MPKKSGTRSGGRGGDGGGRGGDGGGRGGWYRGGYDPVAHAARGGRRGGRSVVDPNADHVTFTWGGRHVSPDATYTRQQPSDLQRKKQGHRGTAQPGGEDRFTYGLSLKSMQTAAKHNIYQAEKKREEHHRELVGEFGEEAFQTFSAHLETLSNMSITFADLRTWPERDIADSLAEALPAVSVFKRRKLATSVVNYFKKVAAVTPTTQPFVSNVGRFYQTTPADPRRTFVKTLDDVNEQENEAATFATKVMQGTYREAIKLLETVDDVQVLQDIVGRCDPGFLQNLTSVLDGIANEAKKLKKSTSATDKCEPSNEEHPLRKLLRSSDTIHTAELREEWRHRAAYLRDQCAPQKDMVSLFDGHGFVIPELRHDGRINLDMEEQAHVQITPPNKNATVWPAKSGPISVLNLDTFTSRFHRFTFNVFRHFTWDGAFVAGGAILGCLVNWEEKQERNLQRLHAPTTECHALLVKDYEKSLQKQKRTPKHKKSFQNDKFVEFSTDELRFMMVSGLYETHGIPVEVTTLIMSFIDPSPLEMTNVQLRRLSTKDGPYDYNLDMNNQTWGDISPDQSYRVPRTTWGGYAPSWDGFTCPDSADVDVFLTATTEDEAMEKLLRAATELTKGMGEACRDFVLWNSTADRIEDNGDTDYYVDPETGDTKTCPLSWYSEVKDLDPDSPELQEYLKRRVRVLRSGNALSLWVGHPVRNIQIIVMLYHNLHEVLSFFDLDCVTFGFDGSQVYGLRRGIRALRTSTNFVEPTKLRRWSTPPRILKYSTRGFGTLLFEICKHHPRCDVKADTEILMRVENIENNVKSVDPDQEFGYGRVDFPYFQDFNTVAAFTNYVEVYTLKNGYARKQYRVEADLDNAGVAHAGTTRGATVFNSDGQVSAAAAKDESNVHQTVKQPGDKTAFPLHINKSDRFRKYQVGCGLNIVETLRADDKPDMPPVRWRVDDIWSTRHGNEVLPRCRMCSGRIDISLTTTERPQICNVCEALNDSKYNTNVDLKGAVAVVTGGRVKVGYATALLLLRKGAVVHVTSRFPSDAHRRFMDESDAEQFYRRLFVHAVDFTQIESIEKFTQHIRQKYKKLHILVNNAAQTIVRPAEYYDEALAEEDSTTKHNQIVYRNGVRTFVAHNKEKVVYHSDPHASLQLEGSIMHSTNLLASAPPTQRSITAATGASATVDNRSKTQRKKDKKAKQQAGEAQETAVVAEPSRQSSFGARRSVYNHAPIDGNKDLRAVDIHGEFMDKRENTSWTATVNNISLVEATAAHLVNAVAPMNLVTAFSDLLKAPHHQIGNGWSFVINVTSPEGQFSAQFKDGTHPHTNMAKASLNMLTRTISTSMSHDNVFVSSVDSGWVSQMTARQILPPPLTCEDSAARVLDPIFEPLSRYQRGERTEVDGQMITPRFGVLFRNFQVADW